MVDYHKQGQKNKADGAKFELRVRKDLEEQGWIVAKWPNNVEFTPYNCKEENCCVLHKPIGKLIPAKHKFNFFTKVMTIGTGFPDFIAFKNWEDVIYAQLPDITYKIIGVESKSNGMLSKEEKEKCRWLLDKKIFSKILIAHKEKIKNKIKVVYEDFK